MVTGVVAKGMNAVIDGSGLLDVDQDNLIEHNTDTEAMWLSNVERYSEGIVFDFTEPQKLTSIVVWNYNKPGYVDYGIAKADVSVWTEKEGWKSVKQDIVFDKAEGTFDYDSPVVVKLDPVDAQKVRFDNPSSWHKSGQIGISEVRFYKELGANACNPEPWDGANVASQRKMKVLWTAGEDSVIHKIYFGNTKQNMELLGSIKGKPELTFSGLIPNAIYFWCVDEVSQSGKTTVGPVWSFETKGDQLAHWSLDEVSGSVALDQNNSFNGTLNGEPEWLPGKGRFGGALQLDGKDDYVDITDPLTISKDYSISVWIKNGGTDEAMDIVAATGHGNHGILLEIYKDRIRYLHRKPFGNEGGNSINGNGIYTDNNWHHIVIVNSGSCNYLYIDGQLAGFVNNVEKQFDDPVHFVLGKIDHSRTMRNFKGLIDEAYIFGYALSAEQVESLFKENKIVAAEQDEVKLENVSFVEEGESVQEVAEEAAEEAIQAEQSESQPEAGQERKFNLSAVIVIFVVMVVVAVVSSTRKKK